MMNVRLKYVLVFGECLIIWMRYMYQVHFELSSLIHDSVLEVYAMYI